jgi:hypothetical protein
MTVQTLSDEVGAQILCGSARALQENVEGGYCGDLLSWVISRAVAGGVWITIMSNPNVAAVAMLASVSCVLLAEDVEPDPPLLEKAISEDIPLLRSPKSTFELAGQISALLQ